MKRTLFSIAAILCASMVLFSCSKDDNNYPDNSQALTSSFNLKTTDWQKNDAGNYDVTFDLGEITKSINDVGAVWVYYSFNGGVSYELAPSITRTDDKGHTYDFLAESGLDDVGGYVMVTAIPYTNTAVAPYTFNQTDIILKVVSVPSALYNANKNINKADYNEVRKVFNLK